MKSACHCCEPAAAATPLEVWNRPALSAVAYRIGTYSSFRESMVRSISEHPELARLTTRDSDDYGITLLELWAAVADVLTFYQERYANEAFLRTATFPESVSRIADLIGYRPRPGVAARTWLSFTVDSAEPVRVAEGQKVQSVPGQDEEPQTFETLGEVRAHAALNKLPAFPSTAAANPLAQGAATSLLHLPDGAEQASDLAPGQKVVLFTPSGTAGVEEKKIADVRRRDHRVLLAWDRPVEKTGWSASTHARRFRRTFRVFGNAAPDSWVKPVQDPAHPSEPTRILWTLQSAPDRSLGAATSLHLDGRYDDLQVGQDLLVADKSAGGKKTLVTVQQIDQAEASLGALTDTVTHLTVSPQIPAVTDRRTVMIYELEGDRILFSDTSYPASVTGDVLWLPGIVRDVDGDPAVELGRTATPDGFKAGRIVLLEDVEDGRDLLLVDSSAEPVHVTVKEPPVIVPASASEGDFCHVQLRVDSDATLSLDTESLLLMGNVARASHGETVADEVVGSGDASKVFQEFALKKDPLTYLPASGSASGTESTLTLEVNGTLWKQVAEIYGQPADAPAFEVRHDADGKAVLRFGDGRRGSTLPTGTGNVTATYRKGSGLAGRVRAGSLTTPLSRPPGLSEVTNPLPADGGADPETLETSRMEAPRGVRTFGRIVSLQDFEDQVTLSGEVAKALATPLWDGRDQAIHLTVAGQKGVGFSPTALGDLATALRSVRDPNHRLRVHNHRQVFVQLAAGIGVEAGFDPDEVLEDGKQAVLDALAFDSVSLGAPANLSDMYRVLQDVPGVRFVDVDWFMFKLTQFGGFWPTIWELWRRGVLTSGLGLDPVQSRLRLFTALPNPFVPGEIFPAELAAVETPDEDVVLQLREVVS